jgi:signal transduction histidine kinase
VKLNTFKNIDNLSFEAKNLIRNDYKNINNSEVLKLNGWIEVIDSNYNVLYRKGNDPNKENKYTKEKYYKLLNSDSEENTNYMRSFAYNKDANFVLITAVPYRNFFGTFLKDSKLRPKIFFYLTLLFYIITFTISMIIYAKLTSKTFTSSLKKLMEGVKGITEGDYSTRIKLKSENEFGELRDAFNLMVQKIEEETKLKEKSEEIRRRLIMDISHDLKNPLASVIGYADLLIKNENISKENGNKYLRVIEKNSQRANNLIMELLELSKLENIDFKMNCKSEDICEFLRGVIASYIPDMEEKHINYNFDIPKKSIFMDIDINQMDRAISNLILNSIRYNEEGTNLKICLKEQSDLVKIIIEDDGIGIRKELSKDIFEPFVRVDSARNSQSGGTGLGLSITKAIIKKHGGNIELESDNGKGCEFVITLNI